MASTPAKTPAAEEPVAPLPIPPYLIGFLTSLSFMLVELDAGRLMAWRIGSGLYSWTALIGVMFAGMSVGNWIGGRLAEGEHLRRTLGRLLLAGALSTLALIWANHVLLLTDTESLRGASDHASVPGWVVPIAAGLHSAFDRPARLVLTGAIAFFPPALFLGMAGPVIARIALQQAAAAGRTMGDIYAWGAVGSIVGTMAAGFVLIEWLGTRGLLAAVAALLAGLGLLVGRQRILHSAVLGLSIIVLALASAKWRWADELGSRLFLREQGDPLHVAESQYQFVRCDVMLHEIEFEQPPGSGRTTIATVPDPEFRRLKRAGAVRNKLRELRAMTLDHLFHGYIWLHLPAEERLTRSDEDWRERPEAADRRWREAAVFDATDLHYGYEHVYAAFTARIAADRRGGRAGRPLRTLSLGAGAYTFPRYLAERYAGSRHDVVEIDPAVTRAAEKALKLDLSRAGADGEPLLRAYHADARNYTEAAVVQGRKYDAIYGDAFNHYSIPVHLTTKEFHDGVRKLLTPGGAYLAMVIDGYDSGHFLAWYVKTLQQTFPHVYVTCVRPMSLVRTADSERTAERVEFDGVTAELLGDAGAAVLTTPAAEVHSFRRMPVWRMTDKAGRTYDGADLVRNAGAAQLYDDAGRLLIEVPASEVAGVRKSSRPPWRLTTQDGQVHRGATLRFRGGTVRLSAREKADGRRESVTLNAADVRSVQEVRRLGRETFVVAASVEPLDVDRFGLRPADTAGLRTADRRTADTSVLMTDAEIAALFRRTNAGILRDEFAPADVLLLPLFRDEEE